jgi:hypothetical protein
MTTETDGVDPELYDSGNDTTKEDAKPDSVDEQEAQDATGLLSKDSFPGGCKVGDKYEVEITGDHGDQFSIKVVGDDKETSEKPGMSPDEELDSMSKEY